MKNISFKKFAPTLSILSLVVFSAQVSAQTEPKTIHVNPSPQKPLALQPPTPGLAKKSQMKFKNDEEQMSYIIGHQIAESLKRDDLKVDKKMLIKSIDDGLAGKSSALTPQESQEFMKKYIEKEQKVRGEKNQKLGDDFLAKNKKEAGVTTLPSGLQYKVMTEGKGAKPKATDTVSVDYEGTLVNGKVFDSSYQRGQPVSFPVNGVIKGWTEALQLMPEGSTWMVYIPAKLAYGEQAPSPLIGPNSTLVFKVHLISIAKPAPKAAPAPAPAAPNKKADAK
jgi:FKBP-type peptidyl-prolyl cis-trans isomerase